MDERVTEPGDISAQQEPSMFAAVPEDEGGTASSSFKAAAQRYAPLLPCIVGLAFGRAGLIVSSYGSYSSTDEGIFTDGAMLVALAVLAVIFFFIMASKKRLNKPLTNAIMRVCVFIEAAILVTQAVLTMLGAETDAIRFGLSVLCTLTASGAIFYWLRRVRGSATITAAVYVFSALILSEIELYLCALIPVAIANLLAAALVLVQYPCMLWARKRALAHNIQSCTLSSDYFGFTKSMISSKQFLTATAIGIGCLSVVIGLLRGYPDGLPIAFTPVTRAAYAALTIILSATIIVLVAKRHQRIMTVGIFVLMELLACLALVAYAAFPDMLSVGAAFTTTLNALMVAFTWYIIIAFMSYGWREPYYYAIAGWLVWLGCRAIARVALLEVYTLSANDILMNALMGAVLVLSTQVVFVQFLNIARLEGNEREEKEASRASVLTKIMGLDEHESLADMRQASMQHNAEELGKQFLLSDREVEVLTLYALGFTQKRVAEELYISPGTAHAHIKRIYAKTGLHSRQEILDYMQQYAS